MRTTVDIDERILQDISRRTGEKSLNKAINKALADYLRHDRARRLVASLGTWDLDLDDWYEFRHMERA
jgi:Arc/MetJ family transcription regulator